ncbi:antiterminator Q family protein [Moraxella sp. VT-16-12]|uniref:antiterminator Q family protein n=1 Tax=Moraxella sp. VT-16-12 TaxID=2014877 RepID=UPI000B7F5B40|nr:antiterminator Q family protein [Moraxella sp. VT-16-12]TWV80434.1 hypothetical protein CEW93_010125 [Moraxella sp. VT-16-12]
MNWQKYTIDEWLEQFGTWCNQCVAQGGNLPDGLHINQIYWLMQSVEPRPTRPKTICRISDDEAMEINRLLCQAKKVLPTQIELLVANKVQKISLREIAEIYGVKKDKVYLMVMNGLFYLAGLKGLTV